jgi:hypothetical protein
MMAFKRCSYRSIHHKTRHFSAICQLDRSAADVITGESPVDPGGST